MKLLNFGFKSSLLTFARNYLPVFLPASVVILIVIQGATMTEQDNLFPILVSVAFFAFMALPPICYRTNGGKGLLRPAVLHCGDCLAVILVGYFVIPLLPLQSIYLQMLLHTFNFFVLMVMLLRGLSLYQGTVRFSLKDNVVLIWKKSVHILVRFFVGLMPLFALINVEYWIARALVLDQGSSTYFYTLTFSCLITIPASFIPFLMITDLFKSETGNAETES